MFTYTHVVQYYETDRMGITHHSNYIRWMEEARVAMLEDMGFGYQKLESMGIASPVTEVDCKYKAPSTFADVISIHTGIESFNGVVLRMRYGMRKADGTLVCEGHSEHCFLNEKGFFIRLKRDFPDFFQALTDRVEPEAAQGVIAMGFMEREVLPGVWHIRDGLGVCFTLLTGASRALLVDAGYGIEDVSAFIHTLTDLPVTLWLTHGHFDHAPGARWFEDVRLCPAELPVYERYAGADGPRRLADMAAEAGLSVEQPDRLPPKPRLVPGETLCLGGLTARVIPCPGHTPGSAAVFVPERGLLLTGDDWNPCTWLFFPEALPVEIWRENLRRLMDLPFEWVLCPHREKLYPRQALETFLDAATDATLDAAVPSDAGAPYGIDAVEAHLPGEGLLVFDPRKRGQGVNSTAIR